MPYLNWIRASWQCDGCGKDFSVDIDSAWKPPHGWSTTEIAEDAIRHGHQVAKAGETPIDKLCSMQHGMALCADCTRIADDAVPEDRDATREEVCDALGLPVD